MAQGGLSSGDEFLIASAKSYFTETYQNPPLAVAAPLDKNLSWVPTLSFKIHSFLIVAAEVSETPYPLILRIRRHDIQKIHIPIAVYCICPEEAYLKDQASAKALMNDGFGLITVAADGTTQRRAASIPLIQQITDTEFALEIKGLPYFLRRRIAEAFDRYKFSAPSGTADIAEVMEGLILRAGRDAAAKKWIANADAKAGSPARTLGAMDGASEFNNARAAIGAAQGFVNMYRNTSHHFPKDKKQAARKYSDCKHGFVEGIKKICLFRTSMRLLGLSGGL